ncbi:MAG: 50S ribosomal protein L11 [Nanoarchaeota archaeon]|nr:50S ribosomal protein L11 [Nanoarchaeota archaeon]MBU1622232.1 50S ribosomal protein L11 [Nanoarchaeota archaeon]MBU1974747.1 50S ribosomal protein L11 [Nanoarchaeota archaeon]
MAKQTVESLIEAGKATAAPPLGPALGPTGVNIGQVVAEINKKTADLKGMQVPVKVTVDTDTKEFTIVVGTPPAAALIKKEAGIEKGSGNPLTDKVADLKIQQIIKVAKMKEDALLGKNLKAQVREIVGTCQSMGILVEGMDAQDALKAIAEGKFDQQISSGRTELTEEEKKAQEEEKKRLHEEMEKRRAEFETKAKSILAATKDNKKARKAMVDAGIPQPIIDELAPEEKKEAVAGTTTPKATAPAKKK